MDHSIVFQGQIRSDLNLDEVRNNFARLFRLEAGPRLDLLFSGKPVVLKKGLSAEEAQRYAETLLRAGGICEVRRQGAEADTAMPAPAAPTPPPAAPAASKPGWESLTLAPVEKKPAPEEPPPAVTPGHRVAPASNGSSPYAVSPGSRRVEPVGEANTSGMGERAVLPEAAAGLSWGGFLMNWIWGLGNRSYVALVCLIPVVGFFFAFYLLFKGREMAWRNREWESVEHFNRVQRRWAIAGIVVVLIAAMVGFNKSTNREKIDPQALVAHVRAQADMSPEERAADREEYMRQFKSPLIRQQLEEFYREVDRMQAEQSVE
mgnify:CR=1 FL=1